MSAMQDNQSGLSSSVGRGRESHDASHMLGGRGICAILVAARDGLSASTMEAARESLGTIATDRATLAFLNST